MNASHGTAPAPLTILALCGSLRARSINAALLRLAMELAPGGARLHLFESLGELPLFNPDLEASPPQPVLRLRAALARADAVLVASPEYAHGVTGTIKNALDWLVSVEDFVDMPVAVLNAAPRASHADASLREILRTMSAHIVEPASRTIPVPHSRLDEEALAASGPVREALRTSLDALVAAIGGAGDQAQG